MGFSHSNGHGNFRGRSLVSPHPLELPPLSLFISVASLYPRGQSQSSFDHEREDVKDLRETDKVLLASLCRKNVPLSLGFLISVHFLLINTWQEKKGNEVTTALCPSPSVRFPALHFPLGQGVIYEREEIAHN